MRARVDPERPAPRKLQAAVDALRKGEVIVYPTDTGYAYGCALSSLRGIAALRKLKGIHEKHAKPLTMMVNDISTFSMYGVVGNNAFRLLRRILPGAYTIVLRATSDVPKQMKNRAHEVGLRMPGHPVCSMLIDLLGEPLLTGSVTPGEAEPELEDPEILEMQTRDRVAVVVDGGMLWPEPSTVLRLVDEGMEVLREGQGVVPSH